MTCPACGEPQCPRQLLVAGQREAALASQSHFSQRRDGAIESSPERVTVMAGAMLFARPAYRAAKGVGIVHSQRSQPDAPLTRVEQGQGAVRMSGSLARLFKEVRVHALL